MLGDHQRYLLGREVMTLMGFPLHRMNTTEVSDAEARINQNFVVVWHETQENYLYQENSSWHLRISMTWGATPCQSVC